MKLFLLLTIFYLFPTNAKDIPHLNSPVIDQAQLLSPSVERRLDQALKNISLKTQVQLAILTINDLENDSLEGYSIKVVDKWKLGKKETDKGVLLLIVKNQRKIRIEVGQGLEGDIPDVLAGRIIHGMGPYFKSGNTDQGIIFAVVNILKSAGVDTSLFLKNVQGKSSTRVEKQQKSSLATIIFIIFFLLIFRRNPLMAILLFSGSSGRRSGGSFGGGGGFSGGGGGFSGGGASGGW